MNIKPFVCAIQETILSGVLRTGLSFVSIICRYVKLPLPTARLFLKSKMLISIFFLTQLSIACQRQKSKAF